MIFIVDTFGFEVELENIVCDIENEVYEFLFEGKKAQMDLFGADGEPNPFVYVNDADNENENDMIPEMTDTADDPEPNDETAEM